MRRGIGAVFSFTCKALSPILALVAMSFLTGCATIDMDCPTSGSETVSIGGSNIGNQAFTIGQGIASKAGLMASAPKLAADQPSCHVHYTYVPIFGSDSVTATHTDPPASTPLAVTVVPAK